MLGKSYADIVNITNSFLTIRLPRYDIASEFFLKLTCLPYIFYMETCITYNTMLFCSVLISLNRFIAIKYPMNYQFWFSTKMMKYYFAGIFIISISIGYVVLSYEPYYQRLGEENGYFVGFKNKNVGIFTACYTLALYLPCAILAVSLNVITAFELKKYRKQLSI
uniref:G_PROTEIN_RECEP_F1_2 domain-containing protein n=1 Tax=Strongyloides stercoralis TaxID=6248 RepID=A0AAF5D9I5_STRER